MPPAPGRWPRSSTGFAKQAIAPGQHVHTHNLESDYLPTYTLESGRTFVAKQA